MKIAVPYTTRPTMTKNHGPVFAAKPRIERQWAKYSELQAYTDRLYGEAGDISSLIQIAAQATGRPRPDTFVQLALTFEEDVVILHGGRVVAACVCFPSGWIPKEKIGMTLTEIHSPVADNHYLVAASQRIAETISNKDAGSFCRDVWNITSNPHLNNMPGRYNGADPTSIDDLYLRTEHQTTLPLGNDAAMFFINVDVVPLSKVWEEHGKDIISSLNSMTREVLQYKNLIKIREILKEHEQFS